MGCAKYDLIYVYKYVSTELDTNGRFLVVWLSSQPMVLECQGVVMQRKKLRRAMNNDRRCLLSRYSVQIKDIMPILSIYIEAEKIL